MNRVAAPAPVPATAPARRGSEPAVTDTYVSAGSLAIFDLDRTLHSGSGLGVLARLAFRARLIGAGRLAHSLVHDVVFRSRGSTDDQISSIAELALEMAEGVSLDDLAPVVTEAAELIATSIRPAMGLLLNNHLTAGHYCVLLSASPQPLVEEVADLLGFHRGVGTVIEAADGQLTGSIIQPMCYGAGKLDRLAAAVGWTPSTNGDTHTYAYADSESDLPLLESVDSPVVISPDRALRTLAGTKGWPVLDF